MTVDPNVFCDVVSTNEPLAAAGWEVYPNPSHGPISIKGQLSYTTNLIVQLVDVTGRTLHQEQHTAQRGPWQRTLQEINLPAGVYYLTISNEKETISLPIIRR